MGLNGFETQHLPHPGALLWPIYQVNLEVTVLKRPGQEKALQRVQAAVQAALPVGQHGPGDPLMLQVAVAGRGAI